MNSASTNSRKNFLLRSKNGAKNVIFPKQYNFKKENKTFFVICFWTRSIRCTTTESNIKLAIVIAQLLKNWRQKFHILKTILICAPRICLFKVHIIWEGHKILRNLPLTFDCSTVKSKGKISQNFVAFSEYMNFKAMKYSYWASLATVKY